MGNNIFQEFARDPSELTIEHLTPRRPTMGTDIPVVLWRLLRVVGLHEILGEETAAVAYFTGKKMGKMLKAKTHEELREELTRLKIGAISFSAASEDIIHYAIGECMTCDGIAPPLGRAVCQFEAGIITGALENIHPDKKISGEEIKCIGGLGDDVCLIQCTII